MATDAQMKANKANAHHSTGPNTMEGKIAVTQNNFRHGLSGHFQVLPWENGDEYNHLRDRLCAEYQASTPFEEDLVGRMAQHHWFSQRALFLQETCFSPEMPLCEQEKQLALYLRYQTTHEGAFDRCASELRKLRNEKRKAEIGFERQQYQQKEDARKEAEERRGQAAETRKQELHQWAVLLAKAKLDQHSVLTSGARLPQTIGRIRPSGDGDSVVSADAA